jgi:hypothetical protein
VVAGLSGWADAITTPAEVEHIAGILPAEWLAPAATGPPERCAERVHAQFDLGVDGVIMHSSAPAELQPVVHAYRALTRVEEPE